MSQLPRRATTSSVRPRFLRIICLSWALLGLLLGTQFARAQRAPEVEITDISGAIYVSAWEVEKEIIVRPLTLQQLGLDLQLTPGTRVPPAYREALKPRITAFLSEKFPLFIDGETAPFLPPSIQFIDPNPGEFIPLHPDLAVAPEDFMISATYATPLPTLKSQIEFLWQLFPASMDTVPIRIADSLGTHVVEPSPVTGRIDAGVKLAVNLRDAPQAPPAPPKMSLPIPWLTALTLGLSTVFLVRAQRRAAVICAIVALPAWFLVRPNYEFIQKSSAPPPEQAKLITDRLLEGIYHAFSFRDEDAQYDALATITSGDALTTIFLEARRTTGNREREGSQVRIHNVSIQEITAQPLPEKAGFSAHCRWRTAGEIGHWGHFHKRLNVYDADLEIQVVDGQYRLTGLTLNDRQRQ